MIRTIEEIEKLIAIVEESMGDSRYDTFPSPVRAMEVGALLTVARENMELQATIAVALAIGNRDPLSVPSEQTEIYNRGWRDACNEILSILRS